MGIIFYVALGLLLKFVWDVIHLLFSEEYEAEFQYSTRLQSTTRREELTFQYRLSSRNIGPHPRLPEQ